MNLTLETILMIVVQISSVGAMIVVNRNDIKWIKELLADHVVRIRVIEAGKMNLDENK
ncbi:hypothetical protein [Algicola sagamiensis]|uniref:hypothetical protein n=1 Tax=Algicola sagamiensis TaxID=163869 RepID=UPI001B7FCD5F|nr:hypothetical protein [Algicola sagamiensis]